MVLVSVPNGSQSETLASESQNPTIRKIKQVVFLARSSYYFPAMNLKDQTNVAQSISTLLSNPQLQTILQCYGVNSILAGCSGCRR